MATGQNLLNMMEVMNQELQLQPGETDVARGLLALNMAQDFFESLLAQEPEVKGDQIGVVATVDGVETTAFPAGVLRIDRLQYLDTQTNRPAWDLFDIRKTGGHAYNRFWPWNITTTVTPGVPRGYWTDGRNIYWDPLPSGINNVRWYGFKIADDITASGTFAYDDIVMLPVASFAVKLIRIGLDDNGADITALAQATFQSAIKLLSNFNRDGAIPLQYRYTHDA